MTTNFKWILFSLIALTLVIFTFHHNRQITPAQNQVAFSTTTTSTQPDILPTMVGQCSTTTVLRVENRLATPDGPVPDSGSAIKYSNGGYQVLYRQVPEIDASQAGDKVNLCLISIPKNCPPGDDRGKFYKATNLRTGGSWEAADSEHMCGGA